MRVSRRRWLTSLTGLAGLLALGPFRRAPLALLGCAGGEPVEPASVFRIRADAIEDGGRLEVEHQHVHFELRRRGDTVSARSLLCSHQLCRVNWVEAERRYHCPCHEGLFAEDGSVVYGPPTRPLRALTVHRDGPEVWVDAYEVYTATAAATVAPDSAQ